MSDEPSCKICGSSLSQTYPAGRCWTCGEAEDALQEEHVRAKPIMERVQAVARHAAKEAVATAFGKAPRAEGGES